MVRVDISITGRHRGRPLQMLKQALNEGKINDLAVASKNGRELRDCGGKKPSFAEKTRFRRDLEKDLYRTGFAIAFPIRSLDRYSLI